jgi:hypothetical protein
MLIIDNFNNLFVSFTNLNYVPNKKCPFEAGLVEGFLRGNPIARGVPNLRVFKQSRY